MISKTFHTGRYYKWGLLMAAIFISSASRAHSINYALEKSPSHEVIWFYLRLGFEHIIPRGFDHILFVLGLCLISTRIKTILWQATAFTIAHCTTLLLSMKNIIVAPGAIVEPLIALSILFIAVENILLSQVKPWRIAIVFGFGLIHGLGFASALNEIGLPPGKFFTSLLSFNIGVELGQVAVILLFFLLIIFPFSKKASYKKMLVYPLSVVIGLLAAYWTIQRVLV